MHPDERQQRSLKVGRRFKPGARGAVCLLAILLAGGCNVHQFFAGEPSTRQLENKFWAGVRPASGETDRLLRNFRYLKQAGRTHLALQELEQAHRQDPGNLTVIDLLAQCHEELGDWDRAEKLYLEALAHDRDNLALLNNLCFSYYQAGKLDKAESCFGDLLKRQPENAIARNNLGLLLAKTGRQDEAYDLWRKTEGEAVARERLHQALAALGSAPQPKVARRPETKAPAPAASGEAKSSAARAAAAAAVPVAAPVAPNALTSRALGKQTEVLAAPVQPASLPAQPASPEKAASDRQTPEPTPKGKSGEVAPLAAAAKPPVKAEPQASPVPVQPAPRPPAPAGARPASGPEPEKPPVTKVKTAAPAPTKAAPPAAAAGPAEPPRRGFLSAQELLDTRLHILNGNGVRGIAALNRTWLSLEGFTVAAVGNHRDYGLQRTLIQYHPGAEGVAKVLQEGFFPQADLKPESKPDKGAEVRIVLGHDQKARKSQIEERIALLDFKAQLAVILAAAPKKEIDQAAAKPQVQVQASRPVAKAQAATPAPPAPWAPMLGHGAEAPKLTPAELGQTRIELRNGNGVQDQARRLRAELSLQGFNVVRIKNHIDFGMEQTTILHRAGAGKVAQALGAQYFTSAKLVESDKLPENVDVKVVLGKDLPRGPELVAHLTR